MVEVESCCDAKTGRLWCEYGKKEAVKEKEPVAQWMGKKGGTRFRSTKKWLIEMHKCNAFKWAEVESLAAWSLLLALRKALQRQFWTLLQQDIN